MSGDLYRAFIPVWMGTTGGSPAFFFQTMQNGTFELGLLFAESLCQGRSIERARSPRQGPCFHEKSRAKQLLRSTLNSFVNSLRFDTWPGLRLLPYVLLFPCDVFRQPRSERSQVPDDTSGTPSKIVLCPASLSAVRSRSRTFRPVGPRH